EGGYAAAAGGSAGTGHHGEQLGLVGMGDEALGAAEAIDVAVADRPGLHCAAVRSDVRLGEGEAGDDLAAGDARQPLGLLLGRACHHQPLRADADIGAEAGAEGRRGAAELDRDLAFLEHRQPQAAIVLGDRQAEQAERLHLADHLGGDGVRGLHLGFEWAQALAHEAADRIDQRI
ncbi:hypothetical protein QU38_02380, partial [Staphylococcus aureus]